MKYDPGTDLDDISPYAIVYDYECIDKKED